jgi:hypothetical protein
MYCYCAGNCGRVLNCPNEPGIYYCRRCWAALISTLYRVTEHAPDFLQPHVKGLIKTFYQVVRQAPEAEGRVLVMQRTTEAIQ